MDHHSRLFLFLANPPFAVIGTQATTTLVIVLALLLLISFFISGAEVAYFLLSIKDINMLKTKQHSSYKRVVNLIDSPKVLLASITIAHLFINIAVIIIANFLLNELVLWTFNMLWLVTLVKATIITLILLIFSQIMPKVLATQNSIRFAKDSGALIAVIVSIFDGLGIRRMIEASDYIEKKLERKGSDRYNLDEINEVASGGEDETTSQKEKNILKGIVKFSKITVKQIMRARLDVSGVEYETSFAEVIKKIEELHYSRLQYLKTIWTSWLE